MGARSKAIANHFDKDKPIVACEVGVRYGKNAEQILKLLPNMTLYLVDRWEKPAPGDSYYNSGDKIADRPVGHFRKCYNDMLRRTEPYKDRVHVLKMESVEAARKFMAENIQFDLVFLDADHSYEGVRNDIIAWWPLVKVGGYLAGHDYLHATIGEVKRAVDERFPEAEICEDMTWFVRK